MVIMEDVDASSFKTVPIAVCAGCFESKTAADAVAQDAMSKTANKDLRFMARLMQPLFR
jgi:hypothetical protein